MMNPFFEWGGMEAEQSSTPHHLVVFGKGFATTRQH